MFAVRYFVLKSQRYGSVVETCVFGNIGIEYRFKIKCVVFTI